MNFAIKQAKLRGVTSLTIAGGIPIETKNELLTKGYRIVHVPVDYTAWTEPLAEAVWLGPKRNVPGVTEIYFPDERISLSDLIVEAKQFGKQWCEVDRPLTESEWNECVNNFYFVSYENAFGIREPYDYTTQKDSYMGTIRVGFIKL